MRRLKNAILLTLLLKGCWLLEQVPAQVSANQARFDFGIKRVIIRF